MSAPQYPHQIDVDNFEFYLRKPRVSFDVARDLYSVVDKNREFFRPWLGWVDYVKSPEDEFAVVQSVAREELCKYFIYRNMRLIGMVGAVREDKVNQTMEIGYWLDKGVNGGGIMTKAVENVQDLAFEIGGVNRLEIRCATENKRSRAIPERLGFHLDGVLPAAEILRGNVIHDIAVYSKLREKWIKEK